MSGGHASRWQLRPLYLIWYTVLETLDEPLDLDGDFDMQIIVRNLGVIKEAEFDLKPLTIFVGPNNEGKTWLAYTLAGIFGAYGFSQYIFAYRNGQVPDSYPLLEQAIERVQKNGNATIDVVQFLEESGEFFFDRVANFACRWLPQYMGTREASFENFKIKINQTESRGVLVERLLSFETKTEIPAGKPIFNIRKKAGERELLVFTSTQYTSSEGTPEEPVIGNFPPDVIKDFLVQSVFVLFQLLLYPAVRILPTERTTYITFPFKKSTVDTGLFTLVEKRAETDIRQSSGGILVPVGTFLSMIKSSFEYKSQERTRRSEIEKSSQQVKKFVQLARLLEQQILHGEVQISQPTEDFSSEEQNFSRQVLFRPVKNRKLEVSIASSMVKELSPLVIYLRYLALPGELLIIDEPEMNLHPEAQVKLIEFLAMLINAGLNILVTTHSPYVIDHLTNLIKANNAPNKGVICNEFYLKREDAFISKDKVSVYLIDQGKAMNAIGEDGTIELNTFGAISDRISEIYFMLD